MRSDPKADIGVVGLAVMGANLVLNLANKGFAVAVHNRTIETIHEFMEKNGRDKSIVAAETLEDLVGALNPPRRILLMIKAGRAVDQLLERLMPLLSTGDIIIDGGNAHFNDTIRRSRDLKEKNLLFIGAGVSGGEEGALTGPSIMPGGAKEAWPYVKEIFQSIAAKAADNTPCCEWVGAEGAGHFVKMVHNGIEYGDMQLIAEAYHLLKTLPGLSADQMQPLFETWNQGDLNSYLIEITSDILSTKDRDGSPLIEKILDAAGQKGTGKWSVSAALDLGVPLTLIDAAVHARSISAAKEDRVRAENEFRRPQVEFSWDREAFIGELGKALFAAKIISYAQGFGLLGAAETQYNWGLNPALIARLWRGGCIIRSAFLDKIAEAYAHDPGLANLLFSPFFKSAVIDAQQALRKIVAQAVLNGIPVPAFGSALCYFDSLTTARLPANLIQAQRDYFGAHLYERTDHPRGQYFHTNWTGRGGETLSGVYQG